jgi:DNA-binding response OmpR family regulator
VTRDARRSVLVVEDDPDLLALVEMLLADAGHRVRTAPEGRAALARIEEELPGLILLDMRMPGMNGWDFARELRARHGSPCPIVVVTAAEDARRSAEAIGADGFIAKPFDIDEVLAVVERFVGHGAGGEPGGGDARREAEPHPGDGGS